MLYFVEENKPISNDTFSLTFYAPDIAGFSVPGQFLNVRVPFDDSRILRRPFSICDVKNDIVNFSYYVKGEGTRHISKLKHGDEINIIGPLGKGFPIFEKKRVAIVGGGIGAFPLLYLKNRLPSSCRTDCFLGFRDCSCTIYIDDFSKGIYDLCVSTDDGSLYEKGYITDHFNIKADSYDIVYACGPTEMLKAVKIICESRGIPLYMSLEQRMGCGIGACLVCSCKVRSAGPDGYDYKLVCKDGPVFESCEVIL